MFVERIGNLLRPDGWSGFITPNNWLTIDTFTALRQFLLHGFDQLRIINILDRVFEAADVDTAILLVATTSGKRSLSIAEMQDEALVFSRDILENDIHPPSYIIQVSAYKDVRISGLLAAIEKVSRPLSQFATVSTGLKVYQIGKGKPPQSNAVKAGRVFHAETKIDPTYEPYLDGVDVARYALGWSGEYLSYGDWIAEPRRSVPFTGERLLVRQIPGKPPHLIYGVWTDAFCYNDINSMPIFAPSGKASLRSLLAVLNSKLISFWFSKKFDKLQRKIFPQFKVKELAAFPIAHALEEENFQAALTSLADSMLSLHKRLSAEQLPQRREQIQREIDATDRQIDQLVYQLYGLTDAEIAIVEAAMV